MTESRLHRRWSITTGRWIALLLIVTSFAGGLGVGNSLAQETATVRFAFWGDPAEQAAYEQVIATFEAGHPGIEIEIDYTPGQSDFQRKVATDFAGGDPPDVFLINYRQYGQYAARGALAPIGPYLDASTVISADDYAPIPMNAFTYRGGDQVCMPQNVSSLVVYYNVDLFTTNNLPLPTTGWTWDEFIAAATALTQDTDGDGATDQFGVVVEPIMYRMAPFIWSAGGEIVDDETNPTTLTLDTPEAIDGIEKFVSLGVSGHNVVPSEEEVAAEDDGARFMRGGAAMFLQSRREVPTLREIEGFTWDVAPLPVINEPTTVLHSDAFCIAEATEHKDAVWAFIEYAAGEEGQLILAETGRIVPARTSVAESDVFLKGLPMSAVASPEADSTLTAVEGLPPASSQVYLDNVAIMRRFPTLSTWPEVEDAFNAEYDRAFYEEIDVQAAIDAATNNAQDAFDRAAAEDGGSGT
jgi:multiple sugar transport system substrate-binding protein